MQQMFKVTEILLQEGEISFELSPKIFVAFEMFPV